MTGSAAGKLLFLLCAAGLAFPRAALACIGEESAPFREHLENARSVFVFRLESSELRQEWLSPDLSTMTVVGRIRVVHVLKGPKPEFTSFEYQFVCGNLRMDVGSYFVVATTQSGKQLELGNQDRSLLDVGTRYDESLPPSRNGGIILGTIQAFLDGEDLPDDFPSADEQARTMRYVPREPSDPARAGRPAAAGSTPPAAGVR